MNLFGSLSSNQLDAFLAVVTEGSFSAAAKRLHVTQSALSQRVQKLEDSLKVTLIKREVSGIALTDEGQRIIQYCLTRESLEKEVIASLESQKEIVSGKIKIVGYSSVIRSVIQKSLLEVLQKNENVELELSVAKDINLSKYLNQAEASFVVMDRVIEKPGVETYILGQEKYVLVESNKYKINKNTYLDFSKDSPFVPTLLKRQGERVANIKQVFVNDIYGVIEGVQQGLGRGIVPVHLIRQIHDITVVDSWEPQILPVVLHFHKQPYYSSAFEIVLDSLVGNSPGFL